MLPCPQPPGPALTLDLSTCWDLIQGAAAGDGAARQLFAERYAPVARAYLGERWRGAAAANDLDDAVQEVFVDCLRSGGALQRADRERGEFRGFLFGIVRTVALRFERARGKLAARLADIGSALQEMPGDDPALSRVFDREWARATLRAAMATHRERAAARGDDHQRRVELLRLRFDEGLPIRTIAGLWHCDPAWLHHEFARARRDFKAVLGEAMGLPANVAAARLDDEVQKLTEALR